MPGGEPLTRRDALRVVVATVLVVATLAALYLLYLLRSLLITAFAAVIFASALRPIVGTMQRRLRVPRGVAVLGLYGMSALGVAAGLVALVPMLVEGVLGLLERSGEIYGRWYALAASLQADAQARLGLVLPALPAQPQVAALLGQLGARLQQALPALTLRLGGALGEIALGLVMVYYWLEARDDLVALGLRVLPPERHAAFLTIFDEVERALGGYLSGQATLSALIGAACLVVFAVLGLPYAPALALGCGLLHMVPILGATVGTVLVVMVAGVLSPGKALATGALLLLIHQLENHLLAPRVLQRRVGLSPLLVIIALAGGAMLGGVVGALVAIPAAGAGWVLARHLVVEPLASRRRPAEVRAPTGWEPQG